MAEQVIFGKTDKRINSTSQQYTPVITTNVLLKEPCSIVAPTFLVKQPYATMRECNYCEYAGFYYWIDDVISICNTQVEVRCTRDPLASFRDDIVNASAFCNYADKNHNNNKLSDPRFGPDIFSAISSEKHYDINFSNSDVFSSDGCVILKCWGMRSENLDYSGVLTYAIKTQDASRLVNLVNAAIKRQISDKSLEKLVEFFIFSSCTSADLKSSILDFYWVPTAYSALPGAEESLIIGNFIVDDGASSVTTIIGKRVSAGISTVYTKRNSIVQNLHNEISIAYPWLLGPEYCSVQLNHPCGTLQVDTSELVHTGGDLHLHTIYCLTTGEYLIAAKVGGNKSKIIGTASGAMRISLFSDIAANGTDFRDSMRGAVKMGATLATMTSGGNAIARQAGKFVQSIIPTDNPTSRYSASYNTDVLGLYLDGDSDFTNNIYLSVIYTTPEILNTYGSTAYDDFCNKYGWVCKQYLTLDSIVPGSYVQTVGISMSIKSATNGEIASVNAALDSGIYLEE